MPLEQHDDAVTWQPGAADLSSDPATPPYSATFHTERSVHGPVIARATVGGKPVAYTLARSTYFHELETAAAIAKFNAGTDGVRDFLATAARMTGSYNVFYADRKNVGYIQSGIYPRRARGTHSDLPAWGDGRYDWRGFDPVTRSASYLPAKRLPQEVDPKRGYLLSWNNKQAPGWRASDYDWQYGSVHRSQRLERRVRGAIKGKRKVTLGGLVGVMGDAGTVDVRGQEALPWMLRVVGHPSDPALAHAADVLRTWRKGGGPPRRPQRRRQLRLIPRGRAHGRVVAAGDDGDVPAGARREPHGRHRDDQPRRLPADGRSGHVVLRLDELRRRRTCERSSGVASLRPRRASTAAADRCPAAASCCGRRCGMPSPS